MHQSYGATEYDASSQENIEEKNYVDDEQLEDINDRDEEYYNLEAYPDNGWKAWTVVFGAFCVQFSTFGLMNTIGVLLASLSENQLSDFSPSSISWGFFQHTHAYGPRALISAGCLGLTTGLMLFSISTQFYQFFLTFGILGGISASLLLTPSITAVNHWFNFKRGLAVGIASSGGGVGGVVFSLAIRGLIPIVGFAWAIRVIGFIVFTATGTAAILVCTRLRPHKQSSAVIEVAPIFKDMRLMFTTFGVFMIELGLAIPVAYFTSYALSRGVDLSFSYQLLAILNAGSVIGRWIPGWVADHWGRFNTMIITTAGCAICTFSIWMTIVYNNNVGTGPMILYMILFGLFSGSGVSLTPVCLSQIVDLKDYGKRYGAVNGVASLAVLIGSPIAGAFVGAQNNEYGCLVGFCGAIYVVASLFFIIARVCSSDSRFLTIF
ncbi:major facilitator superfamily domain-containing protein [Lipomyces japonicus]|uniref:major facilitator superfamily domain-containing protein n=1 Tax=Lipomyces japonicus TaxID=56871 RepID=UPI0034CEC4B4